MADDLDIDEAVAKLTRHVEKIDRQNEELLRRYHAAAGGDYEFDPKAKMRAGYEESGDPAAVRRARRGRGGADAEGADDE